MPSANRAIVVLDKIAFQTPRVTQRPELKMDLRCRCLKGALEIRFLENGVHVVVGWHSFAQILRYESKFSLVRQQL